MKKNEIKKLSFVFIIIFIFLPTISFSQQENTPCEDYTDCPPYYTCEGGYCVPGFQGPSNDNQIPCTNNSQCPDGQICELALGYCSEQLQTTEYTTTDHSDLLDGDNPPDPNQEEGAVIFTPQISIPGSEFQKGVDFKIEKGTKTIATYISSIYNYLLAIVGLLAAIVLMVSGIIWMTAAGNTERISQAKSWMTGALTGLVLMLVSYVLLKVINPNLVNFRAPFVEIVNKIIVDKTVASKEDLPEDTQLSTVCTKRGYRCQNVSMNNQNTSLITVEDSACIEHFGETKWEERRSDCVISSNGENYLYCCGYSKTEEDELDSFCKGKSNGTRCHMSMTDISETGYCEDGNCKQCISGLDYQGAGQKCTKDYQCATDNAGSSCGNGGGGACLFYVMDVLGSLSNYGYCKVKYSENSCEGTVGGGCIIDSCCQGLCCSHTGVSAVCIPGKQKSSSDDDCLFE